MARTAKAMVAQRRLTTNSQVVKACKRIVRHLHARDLKAGAKLPTQAEFRHTTEFSNDTLSAAMRLLAAAGVLTRKKGLGTVVDNPDAVVRGLWTVGLAFPAEALCNIPFFSQLLGALQSRLVQADCRCRFYLGPSKTVGPRYFSYYPFLEEDLAEGRLDAVITPAEVTAESWEKVLAAGGIPVHVGSYENARCGVLIEQQAMARQAVGLLVRQGCRRLAVAGPAYPNPGYDRYLEGFRAGLAESGLPPAAGEVCSGHVHGVEGGRRIAAELLARPPKKRPDGIVAVDDWLVMGMAAALREAGDYRPRIVVQCNKQASLAFALPVTRFYVDVEELAAQGVALTLERLNAPARPERVVWLPQQLATDEPAGVQA